MVDKERLVTQADLLEHFEYRDGALYRLKKSASGPGKVGERAGRAHNDGYRQICFRNRLYMEHRVIWCMHYGEWPAAQIDHIDGNRSNNRIENLRAATNTTNQWNRAPRGCHRHRDKWQASIMANGVVRHLGTFETEAEASAAYARAKEQLHRIGEDLMVAAG